MYTPAELETALTKLLRQLRIGDSLLFLNKVLAVSQGELIDHHTQVLMQRSCPKGVPPFIVHLITKYLLRHGGMNTAFALDWDRFPRVLDLAFQLAIADPLSDSSDEAVGAYFIRMMSQQMNRHKPMQSYGLAIALFQDLDAIGGPKPFNLRAEVEAKLGMPVELFMRIGLAAHSAACGIHGLTLLRGTLDLGWLKIAEEQLPQVPWLESWSTVASAIATTPAGFNALVDATPKMPDEYVAYSFNPLRRKPVIQVESARYIAVDPWLLVDRTSWGVFYDLFETHAGDKIAVNDFTSKFGQPFEVLLGELLESSLPQGSVWKDSDSELSKARKRGIRPHQLGDFAYRSAGNPVMVECAALRPTANLCAEASAKHCEEAAVKIAKELAQGFAHIDRIQVGDWKSEGLVPGPWVTLVVTFGRFETINGIFLRKLIDRALARKNVTTYPYLVLSIEELDTIARQSEIGQDFGEIIAKLASVPTFNALADFGSQDWRDHVSTYALTRAERMYSFVPAQTA